MQAVTPQRRARLFRNGRSQAVRIPRDFEFGGDEVVMHREGDRLVIEALKSDDGGPRTWAELIDKWREEGPIDDEWPDIERGPARDVDL